MPGSELKFFGGVVVVDSPDGGGDVRVPDKSPALMPKGRGSRSGYTDIAPTAYRLQRDARCKVIMMQRGAAGRLELCLQQMLAAPPAQQPRNPAAKAKTSSKPSLCRTRICCLNLPEQCRAHFVDPDRWGTPLSLPAGVVRPVYALFLLLRSKCCSLSCCSLGNPPSMAAV